MNSKARKWLPWAETHSSGTCQAPPASRHLSWKHLSSLFPWPPQLFIPPISLPREALRTTVYCCALFHWDFVPWENPTPSTTRCSWSVCMSELLWMTEISSGCKRLHLPQQWNLSIVGQPQDTAISNLSSSVHSRSLNGTLGRFSNFLVDFDY